MRSIRIGGIVLVVVAVAVAGYVRSQQPVGGPGERNDFQGKILAVSVRAVNTMLVLEQARIRPLGGQPFLVGKFLDDPSVKGPRGRTTWLALIDVLRIVEFDNVEQLKKAYEGSE
jgi:hypothetical protein